MTDPHGIDPLLGNYFYRSLDILSSAGSLALDNLTIRPLGRSTATLRATIRFDGGSFLSVWMRAGIHVGTPWLLRYSFHYVARDGNLVFRYDNSSHHADLPNAPHHKHESGNGRIIGCPQPGVRQIRDEIAAYLEEQGNYQTTD